MQELFIQLSRNFFDSGYWRQSRTYNDCEAVLDIISQVRFEASEQLARIGGREVTWGQAQWPASVRFLAARWGWTDKKVRCFIASLKKRGIIDTDDSQGVTIITLKEYIVLPKYTKKGTTEGATEDTIIDLLISKLGEFGTQPRAQQGHSKGTKHNKEYIIDSSFHSESCVSEQNLFEPTSSIVENSVETEKQPVEREAVLPLQVKEQYPFDEFWDLYDKKRAKPKCISLYNKLSLKDRKAIFKYLPLYKKAQPNKQYRKDPETFLRNRSWEDEVISASAPAASPASTILTDNSPSKFDNDLWQRNKKA